MHAGVINKTFAAAMLGRLPAVRASAWPALKTASHHMLRSLTTASCEYHAGVGLTPLCSMDTPAPVLPPAVAPAASGAAGRARIASARQSRRISMPVQALATRHAAAAAAPSAAQCVLTEALSSPSLAGASGLAVAAGRALPQHQACALTAVQNCTPPHQVHLRLRRRQS